MFLIQHRRSIIRIFLLTMSLEFTFVDKSSSNQATCKISNRRNISDFRVDTAKMDWHEAWQLCHSRKSTLPVICNSNQQDVLINYLNTNLAALRNAIIWISGRKIAFNDWTWVNGEQSKTGGVTQARYSTHTHIAIEKYQIFKSQPPNLGNLYICQFSGSSCNSENVINVTKGCVRLSDDYRTWYDARNQCLKDSGDLAILNDTDLGILTKSTQQNAVGSYWIGLRNSTWQWIWERQVPSDGSREEIKYSNWSNDTHYESDECISIDASNGKWKANRCSEKTTMVVCQEDYTSSSTTSRTTTSTLSRTTSNTKTSTMLIYSGAGAGIVIIVICIIVIILAVRYTRKSPKKMDQSKGENNSEQNRRNESPNKPSTTLVTSPTNAPANTPVADADDSRGLYAEISLATLNQLEDGARTQQPGVVYAALEFQKEPTYLEPDKKRAHTTDATKVGPMGDVIYAMPDAKSRAVTSPGNESASRPSKVTPQGDVYALPVKNSKSPNANPSHGGIYENL